MNKELTNDILEKTVGGSETSKPEESSAPAFSSSIVGRAYEETGKPYVFGGVGPEGYDDSGFVSYCLTGSHARIGTVSTFLAWPEVSDPLPGDICVNSNHCGIYVGPNMMIHAPTYGAVVSTGSIQPDMKIVRYK